jgi:cyclophilin family peptidyl-prolyl cis-trans isomerase
MERPGEPAPRTEGDVAVIETRFGNIEIAFFDASAPEHVRNFKQLAAARFFDGTAFHRVLPDFIIQGGDPNTRDADPSNDGLGGPGYTLPAEIREKHVSGAVGAARISGETNPEKRSSGSQFYICLRDRPDLDEGGYTVFGRVIKGMDVVRKIAEQPAGRAGKPKDAVRMIRVSLASR